MLCVCILNKNMFQQAEKGAKFWKEVLFPRLAKFDAAIQGNYFFGDVSFVILKWQHFSNFRQLLII